MSNRAGARRGAYKGDLRQPRDVAGKFGVKGQTPSEVSMTAPVDRLADVKLAIARERGGRQASMEREKTLSRELLTITIRKALPTAATLRLAVNSPYPDEEPFLEPAAIYDSDGTELWIHTSDDRDRPSDFLRSIGVTAAFLGEHTRYADIRLPEGYTGIRLG